MGVTWRRLLARSGKADRWAAAPGIVSAMVPGGELGSAATVDDADLRNHGAVLMSDPRHLRMRAFLRMPSRAASMCPTWATFDRTSKWCSRVWRVTSTVIACCQLTISTVLGGGPEGAHDPVFDLNADSLVDAHDRVVWVEQEAETWFGDANLDGEFNSNDFVEVFAVGKYETNEEVGWAEGDWDGSNRFDRADFVAAFQGGGYEAGPRTIPQAVPEPGGMVGWLLVALIWRLRRS